MKKLITIPFFTLLVHAGAAQIMVLNEIYTDPAAGNNEFFELYNNSGSSVNSDCYHLVSYYSSGSVTGFYVIDMPARLVPTNGFLVGASRIPLNVQQQTNVTPSISFAWGSSMPGGYFKRYLRNGASYTEDLSFQPDGFNDLFQKLTGSNAAYHVFIFYNGALVNAFFGGCSQTTVPDYIRSMPALTVPSYCNGIQSGTVTFHFSAIADNQAEYVTATPGSDNGYIREFDGQCGTWKKSAPGVSHTPGYSNGSTTSQGTIDVSISNLLYNTVSQKYYFSFQILSGPADAFPVTATIMDDLGRTDPGNTPNIDESKLPNGLQDAYDALAATVPNLTLASGEQTFIVDPLFYPGAYIYPFPPAGRETREFWLYFRSPSGCFNKAMNVTGQDILPVRFISFRAVRKDKWLHFFWQTGTEIHNRGFFLEEFRNGAWVPQEFIPSLATDGNSHSVLSYTLSMISLEEGSRVYRLRQVSKEELESFSCQVAVEGWKEPMMILVAPNPSPDGSVHIHFSNTGHPRDILITDLSGRIIFSAPNLQQNELFARHLPPGMLVLQVYDHISSAWQKEKICILPH